jgi:hypothetical protein
MCDSHSSLDWVQLAENLAKFELSGDATTGQFKECGMDSLQNRNQRPTLLSLATPDLRSLFLSTAAASGLLLAVSALDPAVFSVATKAQAATTISANINFYEDLAAYGNWVSYQDRYVWIPDKVDDHWRPYTKGHWAYTRRYGWIWVSDERFG